jgi:hypothetical protein
MKEQDAAKPAKEKDRELHAEISENPQLTAEHS